MVDLTEPGVYTALGPIPERIALCADIGLKWYAPQDYNAGARFFDLTPIKQAGLAAPIWGVVYNTWEFSDAGEVIAYIANETHADAEIIDAEKVAENADLEPLLTKLDAFPGPKAFSCIGSSSDWTRWPEPIDVAGMKRRRYVLHPQAYANAYDFLTPKACVDHWVIAKGYPRELVAPTIWLGPSDSVVHPGRVYSFEQWIPLLNEAQCGRNFNIFLDTDITGADAVAIKAYLAQHPYIPPEVHNVEAQLALQDLMASTVQQAAIKKWADANPREASRLASGNYNASDYSTRMGKGLAHLHKAAQ